MRSGSAIARKGWHATLLACSLALGACASSRMDPGAARAIANADYGVARFRLQNNLTQDRSDRNYILDRMRLLITTLADGDPWAAEEVANQTFALLRTQGLNEDKTVPSFVFNEGVRVWKGEPFEQALSYTYVSIQKAMLGEWDNARAAANASLFLLRDFGENEQGEKLSTEEIARKAAAQGKQGDQYLDKGYRVAETDYALGYMLSGIASHAISRDDEARDNWNKAAELNPALVPVRDVLQSGDFNTVFIVDAGQGPRKVAYGPDGALARFEPQNWNAGGPLSISVTSSAPFGAPSSVPATLELAQMARSHLWNNLEDVRVAKSKLGSALQVGGLVVAGTAMQGNRSARTTQQLIGLGMVLAGAVTKANSAADTRHLELLPARVYVVPMKIAAAETTVTLDVGNGIRLVLPSLAPPPAGQKVQLRYVRMPGQMNAGAWASSGEVRYANDRSGVSVAGDDLPYILGGRSVRTPTGEELQHYQQAGYLVGLTTIDLQNLYRAEGIALAPEDAGGRSRVHVLEGGDTLVAPLAGTAGYVRLFCQDHPPYQPRSRELREWLQRWREDSAAAAAGK